MTDDRLDLTRRKALAGLAAVGAAGAGAGLGTSALYSDTESFDGNVIEAGTLDLRVHYETEYSYGEESGEGIHSGVQNGSPSLRYQLSDVKPGDSGSVRLCFSIVDNPAFVWTCGALTGNGENGQTEPEESSDPTAGAGTGELADAIEVTASLSQTVRGRDYERDVFSGSLRSLLATLNNGVFLDGNLQDADPDALTGTEPADNPCLTLDWSLPSSIGNEVQGDSVTFDLAFHAVQQRNNPAGHEANPCLTTTTGDGFGKESFEDGESWFARARYGDDNAGTANPYELGVGTDPNSSSGYASAGHDWTSGGSERFTLAYDADAGEATLTVGEDSVTDAVPPGSDRLAIAVSAPDGGRADVFETRLNGYGVGSTHDVSAFSNETRYLLVEDATLSSDFELSGILRLTWDADTREELPKMSVYVD